MHEYEIMKKTSHLQSTALALSAGLLAFVLDQLSKWVVLRELGPSGDRDVITVIPHTLWFVFVENTGSAFGLFQGRSSILKFIAIVAVAALAIYYLRAARGDRVVSVALGLQVGGALGNIADRFRHDYVVDWIHVPHFPTFNIADSAITIGVVLLMYALIFRDAEQRAQVASSDADARPHAQPLADAGHDD
jgi:signal peptidase II